MVFSYYPGCTLKTKAVELDEYARKILTEARKNREAKDDMSVIVIRVNGI